LDHGDGCRKQHSPDGPPTTTWKSAGLDAVVAMAPKRNIQITEEVFVLADVQRYLLPTQADRWEFENVNRREHLEAGPTKQHAPQVDW
jgi:hypothetical protein